MPLGTEVNLGLGDVVLDGVAASSPPPNRGTAGQCSAHVYCGQTAGWIQTPLSTEVDLGPGHLFPPAKGAQHSLFGPCLLWLQSPISATAELLFIYFVKNM